MTALYLLGKPKACSHEECSETKGQLTYNPWLDNTLFFLMIWWHDLRIMGVMTIQLLWFYNSSAVGIKMCMKGTV